MSLAAVAGGSLPLATYDTGARTTTPELRALRQMRRLESDGYVAAACTRAGTLMVNPKTNRRVTVKLV